MRLLPLSLIGLVLVHFTGLPQGLLEKTKTDQLTALENDIKDQAMKTAAHNLILKYGELGLDPYWNLTFLGDQDTMNEHIRYSIERVSGRWDAFKDQAKICLDYAKNRSETKFTNAMNYYGGLVTHFSVPTSLQNKIIRIWKSQQDPTGLQQIVDNLKPTSQYATDVQSVTCLKQQCKDVKNMLKLVRTALYYLANSRLEKMKQAGL